MYKKEVAHNKIRLNPQIIFEDNHIIVVVKPINMLTQADITGDLDLHSFIKGYIKKRYDKKGNVYLGLIHRLDRPVGGLVCLAKTSKAARRLSEQLRNQKITRNYLAIAEGHMKGSSTLVNYMLKKRKLNKSIIVTEKTPGAQRAELKYSALSYKEDSTLVDVKLKTGRPHQIRLQLAAAGYPIIGDKLYNISGIENDHIALWAYNLSFSHPTRKELMTFQSYPQGGIWERYDKYIKMLLKIK